MRKTLANWESALTAEYTKNTEGMGEVALGNKLVGGSPWPSWPPWLIPTFGVRPD